MPNVRSQTLPRCSTSAANVIRGRPLACLIQSLVRFYIHQILVAELRLRLNLSALRNLRCASCPGWWTALGLPLAVLACTTVMRGASPRSHPQSPRRWPSGSKKSVSCGPHSWSSVVLIRLLPPELGVRRLLPKRFCAFSNVFCPFSLAVLARRTPDAPLSGGRPRSTLLLNPNYSLQIRIRTTEIVWPLLLRYALSLQLLPKICTSIKDKSR